MGVQKGLHIWMGLARDIPNRGGHRSTAGSQERSFMFLVDFFGKKIHVASVFGTSVRLARNVMQVLDLRFFDKFNWYLQFYNIPIITGTY